METIYNYVENPQHKKFLKEGDGIGTSATRAQIISDLKKRGFLVVKGKKLEATELGICHLAALPDTVKSPLLTAVFERILSQIEAGQASLEDFVAGQEKFVRTEIARLQKAAQPPRSETIR